MLMFKCLRKEEAHKTHTHTDTRIHSVDRHYKEEKYNINISLRPATTSWYCPGTLRSQLFLIADLPKQFSVLTLLAGWRGPMAANRQHFRTWPSTTVESEVFRLSNGAGSNIRIFIYQNQSVFSTAFLPPYFVNFPCLTLRIPFISFFRFPLSCLFPVSCFTCLHRFTMFYLIYHIVSYHAGWRLVGISPWASPSHSGGRGSNCPTLTIGGLVSGTLHNIYHIWSSKVDCIDSQVMTRKIRIT